MGEPADNTRTDELIIRIGRGASGDSAGPTGKRAAIVQAATGLFLRQGYQGTSTDQIAAVAAVSKQTVYNQFRDKKTLFAEIILGVTATAERFAAELPNEITGVRAADDVEPALRSLAHRYLSTVLNPQVLALRRLIIGEASRFPELASEYHRRAPARVLAALADVFSRLADRGLLTGDPSDAAEDFAFLVLGPALDHGMFHVDDDPMPEPAVRRAADRAVAVFLAGYRRPS
ncbi:TetR/AcrR family transcriptional regulator [Actinocatenispora comari]|uniref:TetR family transcriptional regulator n=1 Tax=Actinocatenispora comari TaxID=2807577 RepID=A0A8J4ACL9_9ACTN|nr:TetR/AcrR family transcriptional regulator [Actinocatenispora comari]GIL28558.1 TetR family transcriptional regulator [Actinocatenispora comari]